MKYSQVRRGKETARRSSKVALSPYYLEEIAMTQADILEARSAPVRQPTPAS
jgi:hypothetical protein